MSRSRFRISISRCPSRGCKSDRRFVEDVKRADQRGSQRSRKLNALGFAAGKSRREAVQRQVLEADIIQESQTGLNLQQNAFGDLGLCGTQFEIRKEIVAFLDRHAADIGDVLAVDENIAGFLT